MTAVRSQFLAGRPKFWSRNWKKPKKNTEGLAVDLDDVLIYALYPVTGKKFLNWKYGKEQPPPEVSPRTLEDAKAELEMLKKAKAGELIEKTG